MLCSISTPFVIPTHKFKAGVHGDGVGRLMRSGSRHTRPIPRHVALSALAPTEPTEDSSATTHPLTRWDRRTALGALASSCSLTVAHPFTALALVDDAVVEGYTGRVRVGPSTTDDAPSQPKDPLQSFVTRAYQFKYDPELFEPQDVSETYQPNSTIGSNPQLLYGNAAAPANPLEVKFLTKDGLSVSVAQRISSSVKQTFTQVTDISQVGTAEEVASLVVPPGSTVTAFGTFAKRSVGRIGKNGVQKAGIPHQYYIYKFVRGDLGGFLVASGNKGKVFVLLAAGDKKIVELPENEKMLRAVADSFQLR